MRIQLLSTPSISRCLRFSHKKSLCTRPRENFSSPTFVKKVIFELFVAVFGITRRYSFGQWNVYFAKIMTFQFYSNSLIINTVFIIKELLFLDYKNGVCNQGIRVELHWRNFRKINISLLERASTCDSENRNEKCSNCFFDESWWWEVFTGLHHERFFLWKTLTSANR